MAGEPLVAVGYWFTVHETDLPRPQRLVAQLDDEKDRNHLVAYLAGASENEAWRGYSYCRFACGVADEEVGHRDLTDGVWVWPEGLSHYVARHGIALPRSFLEHARSKSFACPSGSRPWHRLRFPRLEGVGACPRRHEWIELCHRLARELPAGHLLAGRNVDVTAIRVDRSAVMFRVESLGQAVVQLAWTASPSTRPAQPVTTVYADWDAWPVLPP